MTVKEGVAENNGEEKNILVGIRFDGDGRDLLSWTLAKIAKPGYRVIAVHVATDSEKPSILSLVTTLDAYLAVYEGFCNSKQVDLVGRISRGRSVREVLVREAKLFAAMTVVVGTSKQNSIGCSLSLAKYCAKKLSPTIHLLAVHNGKIIFQRDATKHPPDPGTVQRPSLRNLLRRSFSLDSKVVICSCKEKPNCEVLQWPEISENMNGKNKGECLSSSEACESNPCTVETGSLEETEENHFHFDPYKQEENHPSSISILIRKLPEPRPGWPLLRRALSSNCKAMSAKEARRMSVVQWAMQLPSRSLLSNAQEPKIRLDNIDNLSNSTEPNKLPKELEFLKHRNSSNCRWFNYNELQSLSPRFSSENLIGKGGCSRVYKGYLPNGYQVAVKISKLTKETWKEFLLEVDIITTLQHRHIISLIGICIEENSLISVYNFLSRGNLEENLHSKGSKSVLPWEVRFKVAVGVAEALDYLHNSSSKPVIHRDVKSSNILLSDGFEPQLSDFGLALWAPTSSLYITHSNVVGTFGYLAPEYCMYGKVSAKIDVYSFGVVLLELLSGRKPISTEDSKGQESLVMWATPKLENGEIIDLVDPNLDGKFDENQMRRMVLAASLCIRRTARLRPQMSLILKVLQGDGDVENFNAVVAKDSDGVDEEVYPSFDMESHLQPCSA